MVTTRVITPRKLSIIDTNLVITLPLRGILIPSGVPRQFNNNTIITTHMIHTGHLSTQEDMKMAMINPSIQSSDILKRLETVKPSMTRMNRIIIKMSTKMNSIMIPMRIRNPDRTISATPTLDTLPRQLLPFAQRGGPTLGSPVTNGSLRQLCRLSFSKPVVLLSTVTLLPHLMRLPRMDSIPLSTSSLTSTAPCTPATRTPPEDRSTPK